MRVSIDRQGSAYEDVLFEETAARLGELNAIDRDLPTPRAPAHPTAQGACQDLMAEADADDRHLRILVDLAHEVHKPHDPRVVGERGVLCAASDYEGISQQRARGARRTTSCHEYGIYLINVRQVAHLHHVAFRDVQLDIVGLPGAHDGLETPTQEALEHVAIRAIPLPNGRDRGIALQHRNRERAHSRLYWDLKGWDGVVVLNETVLRHSCHRTRLFYP